VNFSISNPNITLRESRFKEKSLGKEVRMGLKSVVSKAAPKGFRWVFCRYRKVRGKSAKSP
jgi:hypothetical protein